MSWTRTVATGSGLVSWRVSVDGWPYEFVSTRAMEGTFSGRTRIVGLRSESIKISETVDIVRAKWEAQGFRVEVADVDGQVSQAFRRPSAITYLAESDGTLTDSDTSMTVKSTAGFASSGYLHLDTEAIQYSGKTATTFTGLTRGIWNTRGQYHYSPDGDQTRFPEISEVPQIMEGRRCRVYAYGAGDDPQGSGAQVWVGVVRTEPAYSNGSWSFTVDPLSSLLDQDLASDLETPTTIRGIYYPATAPLLVDIVERSGASYFGTSESAIVRFAIAGFWASNEAFCTALTTQIAAQIASPDSGTFTQTNIRAVPDGASWVVRFTTTSTNERALFIRWESATDLSAASPTVDGAERLIATVSASTTYTFKQSADFAGLGTVPRTTFGVYGTGTVAGRLNDARKINVDEATNPAFRLYLSDAAGVTSNVTAVGAEWTSTGLAVDSASAEPFTTGVSSVDTTNRAITLFRPASLSRIGLEAQRYSATARSLPEIRLGRDYGAGGLGDFITTLTGDTAQFLNTGAVPDLWSQDIEVGELTAAAAGSVYTSRRYFSAFAEVALRDLIEAECMLLGAFPCYSSNGKITFRRLRLPSASEAADHTLGPSEILTDDSFPEYTQSALGLFNSVVYKTGYNARDGEWLGPQIKVRDVAAFGLKPAARAVEVAPLSEDPPGPVPIEDLVRIAGRGLGVFGGPYQYVTVEVPITRITSILLGDAVSLTSSQVPDGEGGKGIADKIGIVVGRSFSPMSARGELTVLTTGQRIGGYVPAAKISAISGTSGTTGPFELTLDSTYFPSGTTVLTWWTAGDKVRVYQWGSSTPGTIAATVTGRSATILRVETDANWTHSGSTWAVGAQVSTSITATTQRVYAYIAGTDGDLDWSGSTDNPPFTFAP